MELRRLGGIEGSLTVSALGLGCMGMTWAYSGGGMRPKPRPRSSKALDAGVTLFDTAGGLRPVLRTSSLVGRLLRGERRDRAVLATKFGFRIAADGQISGRRQPAGAHPRGGRGLARAAGNRPDRPALPAPRGPGWCRSRMSSVPWPSSSPPERSDIWGSRKPAPPRSAARPCRAPDHRAAVRVLPLGASDRNRDSSDLSGARYRRGALFAARPRVSYRRPDPRRRPARGRLSPQPAAAAGRELRPEHGAGRPSARSCHPGGRLARADRARLAAGPGTGCGADLRHHPTRAAAGEPRGGILQLAACDQFLLDQTFAPDTVSGARYSEAGLALLDRG